MPRWRAAAESTPGRSSTTTTTTPPHGGGCRSQARTRPTAGPGRRPCRLRRVRPGAGHRTRHEAAEGRAVGPDGGVGRVPPGQVDVGRGREGDRVVVEHVDRGHPDLRVADTAGGSSSWRSSQRRLRVRSWRPRVTSPRSWPGYHRFGTGSSECRYPRIPEAWTAPTRVGRSVAIGASGPVGVPSRRFTQCPDYGTEEAADQLLHDKMGLTPPQSRVSYAYSPGSIGPGPTNAIQSAERSIASSGPVV